MEAVVERGTATAAKIDGFTMRADGHRGTHRQGWRIFRHGLYTRSSASRRPASRRTVIVLIDSPHCKVKATADGRGAGFPADHRIVAAAPGDWSDSECPITRHGHARGGRCGEAASDADGLSHSRDGPCSRRRGLMPISRTRSREAISRVTHLGLVFAHRAPASWSSSRLSQAGPMPARPHPLWTGGPKAIPCLRPRFATRAAP